MRYRAALVTFVRPGEEGDGARVGVFAALVHVEAGDGHVHAQQAVQSEKPSQFSI